MRGLIVVGTLSIIVGVIVAIAAAWLMSDQVAPEMVPSGGGLEAPKARLMALIVDGVMRPPIATGWIAPLWGGLALALIALGIGQVRLRRWARALTPWWALLMLAAVTAAVVVACLNAELRGEPVAVVLPRLAPVLVLAIHPVALCIVATRRRWRAAFD